MLKVWIILVCCAICVTIYRLRLRSKHEHKEPASKSPAKLALIDLFRIKKNISEDSYDDVSVMLSNVLKQYLVRIFPYIHIGMTNTEIIDTLRRDVNNDWQIISQITEILSLTERVNFAKKRLNVPQQMGLCKKTGKIILKTWQLKREKYAHR